MKPIHHLQVGDRLGMVSFGPLSRLDLIKYAGASGDYNPIHTIDEEAHKAGLPGIISQGMLTMGRMSTLFTPYLEEGFIQEYSTRFTGMVFLGDVITIQAHLIKKEEDILQFEVKAQNQKDEVVARGILYFQIYE